jgi:trk system potassium uptake protein TrkH
MSVLVLSNAAVMLLFGLFIGAEALVFPDIREPFFEAFALLVATGLFLGVASWRPVNSLSRRHTFLLTSSVWFTAGMAGALPLWLWQLAPADAIFESFSGLTTTGSTVMSGLDRTPLGVLLWRALLQGFGGIGFVVTGMALLLFLGAGGMQLFRSESSDKGEKEFGTARLVAGSTLSVYLVLIALCALTYRLGGMGGFDAVTHALTTLSTGGFSNYDASFGHFQSGFLQWAAVVFMVLGGLPFAWYVRALHRGEFASEQVTMLLKTLAVVIVAMAAWLAWTTGRGIGESLRTVAFNVVSVVTTTGYATEDFLLWGPLAVAMFFFLMAMGGCTGSTAGGAKIMRWVILFRSVKASLRRIRSPHGVFPVRYEGLPVSEDVRLGVASFFTFFVLTIGLMAVALALAGLDFDTALSGALTAVTNVGPGVGDIIGPAGNFAPLSALSKLILSFGMYVGRLEMLTVYVLFTPNFWREI